jgi:hypothetical protein
MALGWPTEAFAQLSCQSLFNEADANGIESLKKNLPRIADPVALVEKYEVIQEEWNQLHPDDLNNFPMPEMGFSAEKLRIILSKIKRPAANRLMAEKIAKDLLELKSKKYPYSDTFAKLFEASEIIKLKIPLFQTMESRRKFLFSLARLLPVEIQKQFENEEKEVKSLLKSNQFILISETGAVYQNPDISPEHPIFKAISKFSNKFLKTYEDFFKSDSFVNFRNELQAEIEKLQQDPVVNSEALKIHQRLFKFSITQFREEYQREIAPKPDEDLEEIVIAEEIERFRKSNHKGILFPMIGEQSIEGIAEGTMIGLWMVQFGKMLHGDSTWLDATQLPYHDLGHAFVASDKSILLLPRQTRLQILREIAELPTKRQRNIIKFVLYRVNHEQTYLNFFAPTEFSETIPEEAFVRAVKQYHKEQTGMEISTEEVLWLRDWVKLHIVSRI